MSLALVQDYSSDEEVRQVLPFDSDESDEEPDALPEIKAEPVVEAKKDSSSLLPSPADVFAEVTGPPEYLKYAVTGPIPSRPLSRRHSEAAESNSGAPLSSNQQGRKVQTSGVVVEAKPVLIQADRKESSVPVETGPKFPGAALPPPEDAANLLRICLKCGVPKTFSHSEGMVCPTCHDRKGLDPEAAAAAAAERKKRTVVKDKEKSKRMKGQSSHATWKSETEMHLRQQFD